MLAIHKGVFGLNDAPRKWWLRVSSILVELGFERHPMCLGMFFLVGPTGVLAGVI